MSDVLMEDLYPWEGPAGLPRKANPRQGKRKKDRWAPCRLCGTPGVYRCARCKHWLCFQCVRFRKIPGGKTGSYYAHCFPKCIRRKTRMEIEP